MDINQIAKMIVDKATDQEKAIEKPVPVKKPSKKKVN